MRILGWGLSPKRQRGMLHDHSSLALRAKNPIKLTMCDWRAGAGPAFRHKPRARRIADEPLAGDIAADDVELAVAVDIADLDVAPVARCGPLGPALVDERSIRFRRADPPG